LAIPSIMATLLRVFGLLIVVGFSSALFSSTCQNATEVADFKASELAGDWVPVRAYFTYCTTTGVTIKIDGTNLDYVRKFTFFPSTHEYTLAGGTFTRSEDHYFLWWKTGNTFITQTVIAAGKAKPTDTQYSYVLIQQCILKTCGNHKFVDYQYPLLLSRTGVDPNVTDVNTLIDGIDKGLSFATCRT